MEWKNRGSKKCLLVKGQRQVGKTFIIRRFAQDNYGTVIYADLSSDTDFRAAMADLGESLAGKGPVLGELGDFCVQVFGPSQEEELLDPSVQVQAAQD